MASEARWQTRIAAEESDTICEDSLSDGVFDRPLDQRMMEHPIMDQPMDPRAAESLLRRLAERFEESERRYGLALEELHSRLDHLSQTTDAARDTVASADVDTFERLHTQVSDLARRLEGDASTPLDNFERLGKALAGGMRGDLEDGAPAAFKPTPEPSPFAQSVLTSKARPSFTPESDLPGSYGNAALAPAHEAPAPAGSLRPADDLDKRLTEMAGKLEQSIAAAIPTGTIEILNARIEDIGSRIARAGEARPDRATLEQVESQIFDMGQHLARAEAQLSRIDGVEEHLLNLIARLDEKDAAPNAAKIDSTQLQEIAAKAATKAATDAARLVAGDTKNTTERLDAVQRELTTMSEKSSESGDRLVSTLEAMHESLKQLVRQAETPQATGTHTPFAGPRATTPEVPVTESHQEPGQDVPWARASKPETVSETPASGVPLAKSNGGTNPEDAGTGMTETSRMRLRARVLGLGEAEPPHAPGPTKPSETSEDAIDDGLPSALPDDLVAAARHAAQAAAARAEKRASQRSTPKLPDDAAYEQPMSRRRPLLIISAAVLLAISALLLYGRLDTKTEPEAGAAPAATTQPQADEGQVPVIPKTSSPAPVTTPDAGSKPTNDTKDGSTGQVPSGATDTARFSRGSAPKLTPRLAAFDSSGAETLPAGVVFAIEDPSSAAEATSVETLPAGAAQASPLVTRAQELLNTLGYDVGTPDGLMGERTSSGVRLFQQRNGLEETGDVTIPLVRMLERHAS